MLELLVDRWWEPAGDTVIERVFGDRFESPAHEKRLIACGAARIVGSEDTAPVAEDTPVAEPAPVADPPAPEPEVAPTGRPSKAMDMKSWSDYAASIGIDVAKYKTKKDLIAAVIAVEGE